MKKIVICILLFMLLTSCTLQVLDRDGFKLFMYGNFIDESNACAQSKAGFEVDGNFYFEHVGDKPYTIVNTKPYDIKVKITNNYGSKWVTISDNLVVE